MNRQIIEITLSDLKKQLPDYVLKAGKTLLDNGFEAYLVGGAVRDILLGRDPKDFDIASNALPEQMEKIFPKSVTTNAKFGTVLVIIESTTGERFDVEVTTYRKEEDYVGGRWPSKVEFTTDIKNDLSRRDFTINAIALNLAELDSAADLDKITVDPFNGRQDLAAKLIKAVGIPLERFTEDGLRAYKACRLAAELSFTIDPATFDAIKQTLEIAKKISMERVRDELIKLLTYAPQPSVGIELMHQAGLLGLFMPELLETINVNQPHFHVDDVYTHSLKSLDLAQDSVKLAALLHDIGKARTMLVDDKGTHFYSHDVEGAKMVEAILTRLKFPKNEVKRVVNLVRWHMFYYPSADWRKTNNLDGNVEAINQTQGGWTDSAIRRFIRNVGEDAVDDLFKLRIADATSNPKSEFNAKEIEALEKRISEVRAEDMAIKISDLDINGQDLVELNIPSGPEMGKILNALLEMVIENPLLNSKEQLSKLALELWEKEAPKSN